MGLKKKRPKTVDRSTDADNPRLQPQSGTLLSLVPSHSARGQSQEAWPPDRQGGAGKVQVDLRLRRETTMSLKWIAQELRMGSWTYVANLLRQTKSLNSKD